LALKHYVGFIISLPIKIKIAPFILSVSNFRMEFLGTIESNQRIHLRIWELSLLGGLRFIEQYLELKKPAYLVTNQDGCTINPFNS
jgi:hypothetical protein